MQAVLIVGAGPRLGAAIARELARGGRSVGLIGRSAGTVGTVTEMLREAGIDTYGAAADVADPAALADAISELAERTGGFDVAVHNVSAWRDAGAEALTADGLLADLAAGTASLATMTKTVVPGMLSAGGGTILATGSAAAEFPTPGAPSLSVQKAALRALVRGYAAELTPRGVHCATVTINGVLGTEGFDVADIAAVYGELVAETGRPADVWRTVVDYPGRVSKREL